MSVPHSALPAPFDITKESAFIQACANGDEKMVVELLSITPQLANQPASDGRSPLMFAAEEGYQSIVQLLLFYNADADAVVLAGPCQGMTVFWWGLWWAAQHGHWEVVKALLEKGANPNLSPAAGPHQGLSPLMLAAKSGNLAAVRLLLFHQADVNAVIPTGPNKGITAL